MDRKKPVYVIRSCTRTGIVRVSLVGEPESEQLCHPSIPLSGAPALMQNMGYWNRKGRVRKTEYAYVNIDAFAITDRCSREASYLCQCDACKERRKK